jgi:hypothetical protein
VERADRQIPNRDEPHARLLPERSPAPLGPRSRVRALLEAVALRLGDDG